METNVANECKRRLERFRAFELSSHQISCQCEHNKKHIGHKGKVWQAFWNCLCKDIIKTMGVVRNTHHEQK